MATFQFRDKSVYYEVSGHGRPLIIIHGNTGSSKMNRGITKLLHRDFKIISLDLPGHGKSDRVNVWPVDYWYDHAGAVLALVDHLNLASSILMGSSGGAQIAINAVLLRPDAFSLLIADSFEGENSLSSYADHVEKEREGLKKNPFAALYWKSLHGSDWKEIIDKDTYITQRHHKEIGRFFHQDIRAIKIPVLLTGSRKDAYFTDYDSIFREIKTKISQAEIILYDKGRHPAMISCAKAFARDVKAFIYKHSQTL